MRRWLAWAVLALCLGGCSGDEERAELLVYVKGLQRFQVYNQQVQHYISFFEAPGRPVTQTEVDAARSLLEEYARAVKETDPSSFEGSGLREAHNFYILACEHAQQLTADSTGADTRQQARTAAFALRTLRAYITGRFYPGLQVLMARQRLELGEGALAWPE